MVASDVSENIKSFLWYASRNFREVNVDRGSRRARRPSILAFCLSTLSALGERALERFNQDYTNCIIGLPLLLVPSRVAFIDG